jgi:hypothetical protein
MGSGYTKVAVASLDGGRDGSADLALGRLPRAET